MNILKKFFVIKNGFKDIQLFLFFCFVIFFASLVPASAEDILIPKVIRVGWYESASFQEGMSDDVEKEGYAYEYLHKVSDYTGWDYEYVYGEWSDLYSMLEDGSIDVLAGVSLTDERKEKILFPDYAMGTDKYFLYQHGYSKLLDATNPASFKGRKIGGVRNNRMTFFLEQWAKNNNIDLDIVYYDGFSERDSDFAVGILDGITATEYNVLNNESYSPVVKVGEEPFYLAVSKNRDDILVELNRALGIIELVNPYTLQRLQYDTYGESIINRSLSEDEEKYIETHNVLRVGYIKDYMPFCGEDEDGNVIGVITDLIDIIMKSVRIEDKISISYVGYDSFKDMGDGLKAGEIDCSFPVIAERKYLNEMNIHGTSAFITVPFYIAYTGIYSDSSVKTIVLNSRPIKKIQDCYPESNFITLPNANECLDLVLKDGTTSCIMSSYRLKHLLNKHKYHGIKTMPFDFNISYCLGVSKYSPELFSILNKGTAFIDNSEITDHIFKYIQAGYEYSLEDFVKDNVIILSVITFVVFGIVILFLSFYVLTIARSRKKAQLLNDRLKESSILQAKKNEELTGALAKVNVLVALCQDYEAVHVVDLDAQTFSSLRVSRVMERFHFSEEPLPYSESVTELINQFVLPSERKAFLDFVEINAMKERIEKNSKFSYRYAILPDETNSYIYEMTFVRVSDEPGCHQIVIGIKCIDDILKIEREQGQYNEALLYDCVFFYEFDVTVGTIDGKFSSRVGYNPLFDLEFDFPMTYDEFNKIRREKLGLRPASDKENIYWTCEGIQQAYNEGKKTVMLRYASRTLKTFFSTTIVLTEDPINHHLHAVYICKDVTDVVAQEQKQKQDMEQALIAAQKANVAKSEFLSKMSHDIRTPLNGIIGLLEISDSHKDDIEFLAANRKKERIAANHLLCLINDVLDMSKLGDENTELPYEPFNILKICEEVLTICGIRAKENGITATNDGGKNLKYPEVFGSPLHLKQIFMNLVNNAIKYNSQNGTIFCSSEIKSYDGETVVYSFTIKDTGIGIGKEFLNCIYEPFTQERNDARSRYQGTGIGMAIVKTLVDKMKGTIECESEVGVGTTFIVTIPFKVNHSDVESLSKNKIKKVQSISGMRILLAEDNELNIEIAKTLLEDSGAVVTVAENGQEAYDLFVNKRAGSFDVILMDIMMPVMNGYKATEQIRCSDKSDASTIPIIAMTANAFAEDIKKARLAGMNGHVSKPIELDVLIGTIAEFRN